jgi:uncharacterized protein (DUF1778 family)
MGESGLIQQRERRDKQLNVPVTLKEREYIKYWAAKRDLSVSDFVRYAMNWYIEELEEKYEKGK